jgi:hypothetical protein
MISVRNHYLVMIEEHSVHEDDISEQKQFSVKKGLLH